MSIDFEVQFGNQTESRKGKYMPVNTNKLPTVQYKIRVAYLKGGRVILYQSADFADFGFFYEN